MDKGNKVDCLDKMPSNLQLSDFLLFHLCR